MRIVLYSGVQSEYSPSVSKTAIKDAVYNVDAAANPETITVGPISAGGANQTVHVLAEDTEWMTFTTVYTTDAVVAKDNLYIVAANNLQFMPYGKLSVYVDDFYLDIVDEIDTHQVFNFKKDSDNTYWNPKNHNLFANSDDSKGNLSYVDAAGAHFTVKHSSVANTNASWRQKIYAYDYDCGGFFQIKSGYTFVVTLKYKVEALGSNNAFIGIGHTQKGSDNTNPYGNPTLTGQEMAYFPDGWASHGAVDMENTKTITVVFDGDEANYKDSYLVVLAHGSSASANTFLVESITVDAYNSATGVAVVTYDTNGGNPIDLTFLTGGIPSTELPTPTHSNPDKGFAGWYLDAEFTTPVGDTVEAGTYTLYAKWVSEVVNVTLNNAGKIDVVRLAPGATILAAQRPNAKMFFEGWYSDPAYTEEVTVAPGDDCTLYAKYNYTYIGFDNGGVTDKTLSATEIVTDPDNANNKVLEFHTAKGGTHNFELGSYDAENAGAYKFPKTNETYYIEFKIKVLPGNKGGSITLYTGAQSTYSNDVSKTPIGNMGYSWSDATGEKGTDWVTISGYYTVGDNFYRERVNFTVQDQLYWAYCGKENGVVNTAAGAVLIDDVFVGVYSEEVPEGAVGVYFETNANKINPIFGYTGEKLQKPEDPVLPGYEFVGWYTDMNFRNKFNFENSCFGDTTITLYAKWHSSSTIIDFEDFEMHGTTSDRYDDGSSCSRRYDSYRKKGFFEIINYATK